MANVPASRVKHQEIKKEKHSERIFTCKIELRGWIYIVSIINKNNLNYIGPLRIAITKCFAS